MGELEFSSDSPPNNDELNALFAAAWPDHTSRDFQPILARSLAYVVVRVSGRLIGFVNVAGDGGDHAFLLDPTVHPEFQRRGIGTTLLKKAAEFARIRGAEWLHVDFDRGLESFYRKAGYHTTCAALLHLRSVATSRAV
jgi:GNAT superfamily N-acetyltransferase